MTRPLSLLFHLCPQPCCCLPPCLSLSALPHPIFAFPPDYHPKTAEVSETGGKGAYQNMARGNGAHIHEGEPVLSDMEGLLM